MSSVETHQRPLALGVQFLFYRTLAYIPTPIYFGRVIDAACVLRETVSPCSTEKGACELYDPDMFRHIYFGLAMSVKILGFLLLCICYRYSYKRDEREANSVGHLPVEQATDNQTNNNNNDESMSGLLHHQTHHRDNSNVNAPMDTIDEDEAAEGE